MRNLKCLLFISILNIIALNCKEVYNPSPVKNNPFILVVDGIIINGNDSTNITISRTKSLTDSAPTVKELGAKVSLLGESGVSYPFTELGNGQYSTAQLLLNTTEKYQLKIVTGDGNEFRSELSQVLTSPAIDSVYWVQDSAGVQIYLDAHDPTNQTRYYRWENVESWEYHSAYDSYLEYVDANNIIERNLTRQIFRCYQTQLLPNIEVTNTTRLSSDIVYKYKVIDVATGSEKMCAEYSDLIKQYAISEGAFNFWTNLKKNTEQLGTLFDLQPFTELGNIQCVNNPGVKCIGYISFSTVQKRRVFVNKNEIIKWNYFPYYDIQDPCIEYGVYPELISGYFVPPGGPYAYSMIGQGLDSTHSTVYLFSSILCVDCRVHGGSTVKPSFWP
jgi:Domain of unknown function (DUF4249)